MEKYIHKITKDKVEAWQNKKDNIIPEWLQGRGDGEAGKLLIIITTPAGVEEPLKRIERIQPNHWLVYVGKQILIYNEVHFNHYFEKV